MAFAGSEQHGGAPAENGHWRYASQGLRTLKSLYAELGVKRTPPPVESADRTGDETEESKPAASKDADADANSPFDEKMHKLFLAAIFDVGLKTATPKILSQNIELPLECNKEQLKSHLQKYRLNARASRLRFFESCGRTPIEPVIISDNIKRRRSVSSSGNSTGAASAKGNKRSRSSNQKTARCASRSAGASQARTIASNSALSEAAWLTSAHQALRRHSSVPSLPEDLHSEYLRALCRYNSAPGTLGSDTYSHPAAAAAYAAAAAAANGGGSAAAAAAAAAATTTSPYESSSGVPRNGHHVNAMVLSKQHERMLLLQEVRRQQRAQAEALLERQKQQLCQLELQQQEQLRVLSRFHNDGDTETAAAAVLVGEDGLGPVYGDVPTSTAARRSNNEALMSSSRPITDDFSVGESEHAAAAALSSTHPFHSQDPLSDAAAVVGLSRLIALSAAQSNADAMIANSSNHEHATR